MGKKSCSDGDYDGTVSGRPMWSITCGSVGGEVFDV